MADGETLWSIARRYEVTVDAVREANEIEESGTIRPGQTLRIPRAASSTASTTANSARTESGSSRSGTAASTTRTESGSSRPAASGSRAPGEGSTSAARPSSSASGSRPASAARAREHTVGEGETLWGIARRYETTVDSLRRANDLDEDEQIRPGQKLSIPQN